MDVQHFRLETPAVVETRSRAPVHTKRRGCQEPFLRGPIPLSWLARASAAKGSAVAAGLCLWFIRGVAPAMSDTKVTKALRKRLGLSSDQMRRGLLGLESVGLIEFVSRGRGRCPVVRIVGGSTQTVVDRRAENPPEDSRIG